MALSAPLARASDTGFMFPEDQKKFDTPYDSAMRNRGNWTQEKHPDEVLEPYEGPRPAKKPRKHRKPAHQVNQYTSSPSSGAAN